MGERSPYHDSIVIGLVWSIVLGSIVWMGVLFWRSSTSQLGRQRWVGIRLISLGPLACSWWSITVSILYTFLYHFGCDQKEKLGSNFHSGGISFNFQARSDLCIWSAPIVAPIPEKAMVQLLPFIKPELSYQEILDVIPYMRSWLSFVFVQINMVCLHVEFGIVFENLDDHQLYRYRDV